MSETFGSGAVFNGTVTFQDDFSNVLAVDGWLTGGSYGNDHINWVWDPTTNFASGFGPQYGGNFLMDGTPGAWSYFIAFTWDFDNATNLQFSSPGGTYSDSSNVGGNNVNYVDPIVSGSIGSAVPEPATSALFGGGLLALAACMKRFRKRQ